MVASIAFRFSWIFMKILNYPQNTMISSQNLFSQKFSLEMFHKHNQSIRGQPIMYIWYSNVSMYLIYTDFAFYFRRLCPVKLEYTAFRLSDVCLIAWFREKNRFFHSLSVDQNHRKTLDIDFLPEINYETEIMVVHVCPKKIIRYYFVLG